MPMHWMGGTDYIQKTYERRRPAEELHVILMVFVIRSYDVEYSKTIFPVLSLK